MRRAVARFRKKQPSSWGYALASLGVFLLVLALWEGAVRFYGLPPFLLPGPLPVAESLWQGLVGGGLWAHLWVTLQEILLGFLGGSVLGVGLGALVAHSPRLERVLYPYLIASQTAPKLAAAPLLIAWFGVGLLPKVIITVLIAFFPLLENTVTGMRRVPEGRLELFRSLGASPWETFLRLRLPHSLPYVFAGLRVAVVLSVVGAVVAEFTGASKGLGATMIVAQSNLDVARMLAVFVLLTAIGTSLYGVIALLERRLVPWRPAEERT